MASWRRQNQLKKQQAHVCGCGRGHVSAHDGKCGNCRTKREKKELDERHRKGEFDSIRIVNKHHGETGEYIGRGSPLGNPFAIDINKGWDRQRVIDLYQVWLTHRIVNKDPVVMKELYRLKELMSKGQLKLQCFCKPQACHGDVIAAALHVLETPKMLYYAGIGSRATPDDVIEMMRSIGRQLADKWTVRSGFADGADKAFCFGAEEVEGPMENYLPWAGFNGAPLDDPRFIYMDDTNSDLLFKAQMVAQKYHPNWPACSPAAKKMHTRNVMQVLGHDLQTHSDMVVCWTPRASGSGGTGQAIRIARAYGIPVFDIASEEQRVALCAFVEKMEA